MKPKIMTQSFASLSLSLFSEFSPDFPGQGEEEEEDEEEGGFLGAWRSGWDCLDFENRVLFVRRAEPAQSE